MSVRKWNLSKFFMKRGGRARKSASLRCEELESRITPVVGGVNITGSSLYDGVASLTNVTILGALGFSSGSLLYTGTEVITAAHVVKDAPIEAKFLLHRDGIPLYITEVIPRNDGAGTWQIAHPAYSKDRPGENDIAILHFGDPVGPQLGSADFVGPFGAMPGGELGYELYSARDEVGKDFQFAGYGRTGEGKSGATGANDERLRMLGKNRFDATAETMRNEIQLMQVSGDPTEGYYLLRAFGKNDLTSR